MYGVKPNVSSWGGGVTFDHSGDGMYHLFVAEMRRGGLSGWQTQSRCVHAVAKDLRSPFHKVDVALNVWCHGPVILFDRRRHAHLLFHIGAGGQPSQKTSEFLHYSVTGPTGPWLPAPTGPGDCMMPSAAFHPNGTLFAVCGNGATITSASAFDAAWTPQRSIGTPRQWEDPTLWFDRRGHWHIVFHVYALEPFHAHRERYAGHGYSRDGLTWTFSEVEPFNGTIRFEDGTRKTFATRERPQLVFARDDVNRTTPQGLITAVSPQPIGPSCGTCSQQACSQCKVTPGRDWTFTLYQPLG
jgi:hypothetical protein